MPSVLKGLISKGSTTAGAGELLDLIKSNDLGEGTLNNLGSSLGGNNANSLMDMGSKINDSIFGDKAGNMASAPGLNAGASSKLMNIATPLLMGIIGKEAKAKNMDASALSSYLGDQKMKVVGGATSKATQQVNTAASSGGGGSIMRWLIPLFLLLAAGWFFTQYLGDKKAAEATPAAVETGKKVQQKHTVVGGKTHTHADGTVHQGATHGEAKKMTKDGMDKMADGAKGKMDVIKGLSLDADGNLLKNGEIYLKKGEFTVKDGEYFGADGKSLGFLAKVGKAMGDAGKAVGGAVAGAAGKTADAFKNTFGGMFKKKMEGAAVSNYSLSKIVFDSDSRITDFSKNEVEGLAAALKATPDAKIEVQVSAADGANKATTKKRAQVVHDMLVTLGVADKQISAKGLGEGDGKVSIVIE